MSGGGRGQQNGDAVAARLGVLFHFTSPDPISTCPLVGRPTNKHPPAPMSVRPPADVLAAVTTDDSGHRITSVDELADCVDGGTGTGRTPRAALVHHRCGGRTARRASAERAERNAETELLEAEKAALHGLPSTA